jgi:DNA-directed RNA polymerase subunit RPC12/RpoP
MLGQIMLKPSQCSHSSLIEEGGELYCSSCNSYFTKAEIKRLEEVECEHCSATLVVDEICFCRG